MGNHEVFALVKGHRPFWRHHALSDEGRGADVLRDAYITRVSETQRVSYSGPQIFARTNHGTFTGGAASEEETLCDDRGLGARMDPATLALRSRLLLNSETRLPELTVYFRHEYAVTKYQKLSVREIDAPREK